MFKLFFSNFLTRPLLFIYTITGFVVYSHTVHATPPYRIAYFEAGPSIIYAKTLAAIKQTLVKRGWKDKIIFPKDAYYSAGWSPEQRKQWQPIAKEIIQRKDIDMLLVAGTDASTHIVGFNDKTVTLPIVSCCVSYPIESKVVKNATDSGADNLTTRIIPERYIRMFRIFHDEVKFEKLGVLFVDTESGQKFANIHDAEKVSKERGFQLIKEVIIPPLTKERCEQALNNLISRGMDAFFIPSLTCFDWKIDDVNHVLTLLNQHKIPTFARQGSQTVKAGALMGYSTVDYTQRGEFLAERIIRILEGESPHTLTMVDDVIPKISLNTAVAKRIGFDFSIGLLGASDEIYQTLSIEK